MIIIIIVIIKMMRIDNRCVHRASRRATGNDAFHKLNGYALAAVLSCGVCASRLGALSLGV